MSTEETVAFVRHLREIGFRSLAMMPRSFDGVYPFRVRAEGGKLVPEGRSRRYTAITLIGLRDESPSAVSGLLSGQTAQQACERLLADVSTWQKLGDTALALWAACATGADGADRALARLVEFRPDEAAHPTVEVAWALTALSIGRDASANTLAARLADRLTASLADGVWVFPHVLGQSSSRSHVSCFADLVYPVQALAHWYMRCGDRKFLDVATRVARHFCELQGDEGQWWWHYDTRTGAVVEGYPVYAVHQDAMAPMALMAVQDAGGPDFSQPIARGLRWLAASPELRGGSLVDTEAGIIWRKVARREPGKTTRYLRAAASRVRPGFRLSVLDAVFPPGAIDMEDRPYHLGWMFYAWPERRLRDWEQMETRK